LVTVTSSRQSKLSRLNAPDNIVELDMADMPIVLLGKL
jgi:hypothetical protein